MTDVRPALGHVFVLWHAFHFQERAIGYAIQHMSEQRCQLQRNLFKSCSFSDNIHKSKSYGDVVMCNMTAIIANSSKQYTHSTTIVMRCCCPHSMRSAVLQWHHCKGDSGLKPKNGVNTIGIRYNQVGAMVECRSHQKMESAITKGDSNHRVWTER